MIIREYNIQTCHQEGKTIPEVTGVSAPLRAILLVDLDKLPNFPSDCEVFESLLLLVDDTETLSPRGVSF